MAGAAGVSADPAGSVGPVQPQWLCASADLKERDLAVSFDLRFYRRPARGFALRAASHDPAKAPPATSGGT